MRKLDEDKIQSLKETYSVLQYFLLYQNGNKKKI